MRGKMAALGFLFADALETAEVVAILSRALEVSEATIGIFDLDDMPERSILLEVIARGPDFRTDVSLSGRDDQLQTMTSQELAMLVNRVSSKAVLVSTPELADPIWILIHPDGKKSLVRTKIHDGGILLQETISQLPSVRA